MLTFNQKLVRDIDFHIRKIKDNIYTPLAELTVYGFITPEPVPFSQRQQGKSFEFRIGEKWGDLWDCAWVNVRGTLPSSTYEKNITLCFDCGGEALIVDGSGVPLRGLTNVDSTFERSLGMPGKTVWRLPAEYYRSGEVNIWIELACNDLFGASTGGVMRQAHLAHCRDDLRDLYYDAWVLFDLLSCLDAKSPRYKAVLACLNDALNGLGDFSKASVAQCRQALAKELNKQGGDPSLTVTGVGHAHIDLAWLWPIRETKRKGARTFATALDLMSHYADYIFGASQPQLFQWIKDDHPELYQRVKQHVQQGRFEIQGDMWVEADTNVPSGESLVRQFLYGRQFFREEFSQTTRMLWLPDVFGYNANLPQIMRKSGVDYFMTQKLSWNEHNKFPHHTFTWQGIDGSSVLTHMLPEETYNGPAAPRSIRRIEEEYREAGVCDSALMLFGIGDGGGGPGPEHLERLQRIRNLSGISPVKQGKAVDFFRHIEKTQPRYPRYKGELYLEKHQGTLTSQANNKRFNRKMENALRELEFVASRQWLCCQSVYPTDALRALWQETLLYQFHDILPGSSIKRVYDESCARYQVMLTQAQTLTQRYLDEFTSTLAIPPGKTVVHNTVGFTREAWLAQPDGYHHVTLPAFGYAVLGDAQVIPPILATPDHLENALISVDFNDQGHIVAFFDKQAQRPVLQPGSIGNRLAVYDDICADCWDINITYRDRQPQTFTLVSSAAYQDGPHAVVEQHYRYGQSQLCQKISLLPGSKRLTFETHIAWHEDLKMLRTSFVTATPSDDVSCDIQFGKIRRRALTNNVYDAAQFEICAHKWIDYSQRDYGVALLNDGKYGHYAKDGVLDLNLLRSQNHPGVGADRGEHTFSYALFPHTGDEIEGLVNREAMLFNNPVRVSVSEGRTAEKTVALPDSFIHCDSPHICIETVKKTEQGDRLAVRLYEFDGVHAATTITLNAHMGHCCLSNLMEEDEEPLTVSDGCVSLTFTPFEIKTLLIDVA